MKVRINQAKCQGHAMCWLACPEVFQLGEEDGHAHTLLETVPAELEASVDMARRSCPEQAIEIEID